MQDSSKIRNIAIIAHIDHGKTTLIDGIFKAAHLFRDNQVMEERVMDAGNLERERGITIKAKHCTVEWEGYKINIVDTPGTPIFRERSKESSRWSIPSCCSSTRTKGRCRRRVMSSCAR